MDFRGYDGASLLKGVHHRGNISCTIKPAPDQVMFERTDQHMHCRLTIQFSGKWYQSPTEDPVDLTERIRCPSASCPHPSYFILFYLPAVKAISLYFFLSKWYHVTTPPCEPVTELIPSSWDWGSAVLHFNQFSFFSHWCCPSESPKMLRGSARSHREHEIKCFFISKQPCSLPWGYKANVGHIKTTLLTSK